MYKDDLVRQVAEKTGMTQVATLRTINAVLDVIGSTMLSGERIELNGFGVFGIQYRSERLGRNPHTGEAVPIPARAVPSFKPAKAMMKEFTARYGYTPERQDKK